MSTMLTTEEMLIRFAVAVLLGAVIGLERELAGKEAGIRTDVTVAAGAALFSLAGITLPYLMALSPQNLADILAHNGGYLTAVANVVIGVGFLGAGIIVKQGMHVHGLTTAATVWFVAAVGVLCGIGLTSFAAVTALAVTLILFLLRNIDLNKILGHASPDFDDDHSDPHVHD